MAKILSISRERNRRVCLMLLAMTGSLAATSSIVTRLVIASMETGESIPPEMIESYFIAMWTFGAVAAAFVAAILLLRRRKEVGAWAPRGALSALTVLCIVVLDMVVGASFPPPSPNDSMFTPNRARGWFHRRSATGTAGGILFTTNSLGLRSSEVERTKPTGQWRALCVGDSVTFGSGLQAGQTWVEQTAFQLGEMVTDRKIQLVNGGVEGYSTWQEVDLVREIGRILQPDAIVLQFCFNDVLDMSNVPPGMVSGRPLQFTTVDSNHWSGLVRAIQSILSRRRADQIRASQLWAGQNPFTQGAGAHDRGAPMFVEPPPAPIAAGWVRCLASLDELANHCEDEGIKLHIIYFPLLAQLGSGGAAIRPQQHLSDWASKTGIDFLDLSNDFRRTCAAGGRDGRMLMNDEVHPNAAGCRLAGELIAKRLSKWAKRP